MDWKFTYGGFAYAGLPLYYRDHASQHLILIIFKPPLFSKSLSPLLLFISSQLFPLLYADLYTT